MNYYPGVKVSEILELVPDIRVLAGAAGLSRLVRSVGIMEAPDSVQFTRSGDLVLTAMWAIRDDRAAQMRLVPDLAARGVASLAIKFRYVDDLPAEVLKQADELGFPLLQLQPDAAFSDIIIPIIGQVVNRQALVLSRQQQAHRAVMHAMLEAKGLPRLAETLAGLLESPVIIKEPSGQILAIGHWKDSPQQIDFNIWSHLPPRATEYLRSAGDTIHNLETVSVRGQARTRIVTPIKTGHYQYGYVQVWEWNRPLSQLDLSIIDSVTTVIALELTNRRALNEMERRYRNEFLAALFGPRVISETDLLVRARRIGTDLTTPHLVLAVKVHASGTDDSGVSPVAAVDLQDEMYRIVTGVVGLNAMVGQAELLTVILLPITGGTDGRLEGMSIAGKVRSAAGDRPAPLQVSVGIGTVQDGVPGLRRSYQQARQAVGIGDRVWGRGGAFHYNDLGLYQILASLKPTPELTQFLEGIRRLARYDADHRTELMKTLETYLICKGNVRKASEQLFTHYNTILYRLQRITQITGLSPDDANERLYLHVGLEAFKLFGTADTPWSI